MNISKVNQRKSAGGIGQRPPPDDSPLIWRGPLRLIAAGLLLAGGAGLVWLGVDVGYLRTWLESIGPWAPPAFVFVSIILMSLMLPKTAVSLMAGALFGFTLGSALMVVIAVAAAALNYAIGRWWLHDSVLRMLRGKELPSDEPTRTWMHAVRDLAADAGFGLHLLIRLAPVPTMVISYSMGAVGARPRPFLLASAVAIIPQSLWVYSGSSAAIISSADNSPLRWISAVVSVMVAIWISIVVPRQAMKRLRESDSSRSPAAGPETTGPETTGPETTGPEKTTGPETTHPDKIRPETTRTPNQHSGEE